MQRKILVVGGTGLIGGTAALHLAALGHHVSIAGRRAPRPGPLQTLTFEQGSYLDDSFGQERLGAFDTLVFAAGNDLSQLQSGGDQALHFNVANSIGVPAFFKRARQAGIERAIYVGSYYPQLVSADRVAASAYLRSRLAADEGVRALSTVGFESCCLNAPYVVGLIDGGEYQWMEILMRYLLDAGNTAWSIPGGANFISATALAQAVAGAIEHGEAGRAYLIGDENWSFAHLCHLMLGGIERPSVQAVRDEPHPAFYDESLYAGRGATIAFEPDPGRVARLRYPLGTTSDALRAMVPAYRDRVLR